MKRVIIAPYLAHSSLMNLYRKDDPFTDAKFFTKESFLSNFYYQYGDDALLHLMSRYHLDCDAAAQILKMVSKIQIENSSNEKINQIIKYKDELLKDNLIFKNEYIEQELKDALIEIYYYSKDDVELLNFLRGRNYQFINNESNLPSEAHHFHTNNEELSYVFNKIAELLLQGVEGKKIAIYGLLDTDELIFNRLVNNYKFHFNNAFTKTLLSKLYVCRFLTNLLDVDIDEALLIAKREAGEDENFAGFSNIVKQFRIDKLEPKYQIELYKSKLRKVRLSSLKYNDGIEVVNTPICPNDGYLFIVNMVQGKFPTLVRDNSFLNDDEKAESKIVTSIDENSANFSLFSNYLMQKGHIFLSYSDCSFASKYYPSPLIENYSIKVDNENIQNNFYSFDEVQLNYANLLDQERNYLDRKDLLVLFRKSLGIKIPYRIYDSQVKEIKHFAFNQQLKMSYSSTKTYYECAYKYYLSKIIKVDEFETTFNLVLGNIIHDVLENIDRGEFEEIYSKALKRNEESLGKYDWVLLRRLKLDIKRVYDFVKDFEEQVDEGYFEREKQFEIPLDDQIFLQGRIDKLVYSGTDENVAIIDYKSGREEFDQKFVQYGLSLQLPTYSLLLTKLKKEKRISGLFIQGVLLDSSSRYYYRGDESSLVGDYKLKGIINEDDKLAKQLDSTPDFRYLANIKYLKSGEIKSTRSKSDPCFIDFASQAEQLIVDAGYRILNNEFTINPKLYNNQDKSCTYCSFKDICYRKESMYIRYKNEEKTADGEDTD